MKRLTLVYKSIVLLTTIGIIIILFSTFDPSAKLTDDPSTKLLPKIPDITLESIFQTQNDIEELDQNKIITIIATGVTLINLEAPLTKNCPLQTEGMNFCGDTRHIQGIVFAGVDTVSIANNHFGNHGQAGIDETTSLLEKNNIGWSGFGKLDTKQVKNVKFGFLAFNGISTSFDRKNIENEIKEAKQKVDVLVVSVHWGDEYVLVPRKYGNTAPDDPMEIGHLIIDSGADLVIGNHPHWVQGVELYKDKLITYAHGNFIFDQTWSKETQEGIVGEYTFYISEQRGQTSVVKLVNVKYHPILVDVSYQPKFLSEKNGQHIIDRMQESSIQITKK